MGDREDEVWTWPDELDALAAAPESHKLLFENIDTTEIRIISIELKHA
jgi:hypothetical protein